MSEEENTLLARWLSGNLTHAEREQLEKTGDAETLRKIVSTVDKWSLPDLDNNTFETIKRKLEKRSDTKIIPLFRKTSFIAIAAGVVLLAGLFFVFNPFASRAEISEFACNAGETRQFSLPDHTTITLFGKSKISYDKKAFESNRLIKLEGEAFFEVNRKGDFEVDFKQGEVKVLGTKFIISSGDKVASVKCFEGKVKADLGSTSEILTRGMGIKKSADGKTDSFNFSAREYPAPDSHRVIENTALKDVCNSVEIFYDVKIVNNNVDLNRKFSGILHQSDLDSALMMIFTPMNIQYKRENNNIIISNR